MRSTFLGLEVSKRTIQIAQKNLDITQNNLSNVHTTGYTRQRVDLNSSYVSVTGKYSSPLSQLSLAGQGVNAFGVSQIRDPYVDKRYREFTAYVAENDVKHSILSEAEKILDDINNKGLLSNLDNLRSALSKYAADSPYNEELASIVRNEAYSITQTLHSYSTELENLKQENIIAMQDSIDEVNSLIDKIVQYNGIITGEYNVTAADKIYYGETVIGSYAPNELLDARNNLIDELSCFGNIKVYDNNDGSVRIEMAGTDIVNGTKFEHVKMKDYDKYNAAVLIFTNGEPVDVTSGDLKARMDMLNGNGSYFTTPSNQSSDFGIPYYISTLDAFAQSFANLMNEINGCTMDDSSRAMFGTDDDVYDENGVCISRADITAANIKISREWMKEATMIGENYELNAETNEWEWKLSLDGNNVNKLYLGMDQEIRVGRAGEFTGSVYDYCMFVDNRISQSISYTYEQYLLTSKNADSLLDTRQSISGVSDTEEGVNMMNYQKWFNASSRMMTTLDELLDRLINSTGTVGR